MLKVRPQSALQGVYFDYMLYRQNAQPTDRVQLHVSFFTPHPLPTPKLIVNIEQVPVPDEESRIVFLITGSPQCYVWPGNKLLVASGSGPDPTTQRYAVVVPRYGHVECEFSSIDLNEDYFRRSFVVDWATLDEDDLRGNDKQILEVPAASYVVPDEFYVTTDFDMEEDYRVARGTSKIIDNRSTTVVTFPDNILIAWKDAAKERRRDVALLFVGAFLGLLASVVLEATKKYA